MFLSGIEQRALGECFGLLAQDLNESEIRERVGRALLELLHADYFASFVWDAQNNRFGDAVQLNMDTQNLLQYDKWYQFHDPITFALQQSRHATLVSEVMVRQEFVRTEFFNDFLARDGLHWGINLHAFESGQALGDLRIWRSKSRNDFADSDKQLLNLLAPAFVSALRRARGALSSVSAIGTISKLPTFSLQALSKRECDVARCVCKGLTDKEIARELGIGLPSVRTYLQRLFEKLGVHRRAGLAQLALQLAH